MDRQQPSGSGSGTSEYDTLGRRKDLEEKYSSADAHLYLSKQQTESYIEQALTTSPTVKYLLESLKLGGCGVGMPFFKVAKCDAQTGGGFSSEEGVILCHNRLKTYKDVELALAHELIHAYDFCRAADLDFTNCEHHACTEIRAANLSGDCGFFQELLRGKLSDSLIGHQKKCVRRRALLSVSMNPYCQGAKAEQAVTAMMSKCYKDTDPFPKIPNS